MRRLSSYNRRTRAASAVGYSLILGLVGVAALAALTPSGDSVALMMCRAASSMADAVGADGEACLPGGSGGGGSGGGGGGDEDGDGPVLAAVLANVTIDQDDVPGDCVAVQFTNSGDEPVTGFSVPVVTGTYETAGCATTTCVGSLAPGAQCSVSLRGTATSSVTLAGSLTLASANGGSAGVTLGGDAEIERACFAVSLGGGSSDQGEDVAYGDDGYVVVGSTQSFGPGITDMLVARYDENGTLEWARSVGGAGLDTGYSVTYDGGGFVAVGMTRSTFGASPGDSGDVMVVRFLTDGTLDWAYKLRGSQIEYPWSVTADSGGVALTGYTNSFGAGNYDAFVARFTTAGALSWVRTFGGSNMEYGQGITWDGSGYAVTGLTQSYGAGFTDAFLTRLDGSGVPQWTRVFGFAGADEGVDVTYDGSHYAVTGFTFAGDTSAGSDAEMLLARISGTGALQWTRGIGGTDYDYGHGIDWTGSNYVIGGEWRSFAGSPTNYDVIASRFSTAGNHIGTTKFHGVGGEEDYGNDIIWDGDGFAITGMTLNYGAGNYDMLLARFKDDGTIPPSCAPLSTVTPTVTNLSPTNSAPTFAYGATPAFTLVDIEANLVVSDWSGSGSPPTQTDICP